MIKIAFLQKVVGLKQRLSFRTNIAKMRKTIIEYLENEGIKAAVEDGQLLFLYNDHLFSVNLNPFNDDCTECCISFFCDAKEYENLDLETKVYIAAKINTDIDSHAVFLPFNDSFRIQVYFHFTDKQSLLNLFRLFFMELTISLQAAEELLSDSIQEQQQTTSRKIGFLSQSKEQTDNKHSA